MKYAVIIELPETEGLAGTNPPTFSVTYFDTQEELKQFLKGNDFRKDMKVIEYQEMAYTVEKVVTFKKPGATRVS